MAIDLPRDPDSVLNLSTRHAQGYSPAVFKTPRARLLMIRLALAAGSTFAALVLIEFGFRLAVPRYAEPATAVFDTSWERVRRNRPNTSDERTHHDTGKTHLAIWNNLGLRQHRPITIVPAEGEIRVGLFGDSFTENSYLPAPYFFSEVLDYLLSQQTPRASVLNFGMAGYGTDQSYLTYLHAPAAMHLDHVVYTVCHNDMQDLHRNQFFTLDTDGRLVDLGMPQRRWWVPIASRLALTYFAIDMGTRLLDSEAWNWNHTRPLEERLLRHADPDRVTRDDRPKWADTKELYRELAGVIVDHWAEEAAHRNDSFMVMLLPLPREHRMAPLFADHRVVDLYAALDGDAVEGRPPWLLRNDAHWNELGNLLAAVHLYRELAPLLPGQALTEAEIRRSVHAYYQAFDGWQPPVLSDPWDVPASEKAAIRLRYLALERFSSP